ncbi:MAG: aspartate 1-decarboxylase [Acidiferrobacteraceae bacterium]
MQRMFLRGKLHRVRVTGSEPDYEGSVAIDGLLLRAADIREYERIEIYNLRNGARFATYAIAAREGSGTISVNGAASHKAAPGDLVIICAYAYLDEREIAAFKPRLVYVDGDNKVTRVGFEIPVQVA